MADLKTIIPVKGIKAGALEAVLITLTEMVKTKGHGLAHSLNYNLFRGRAVLKDFYDRLEESKKSFMLLDENGEPRKFVILMNGALGPELTEDMTLQPGQQIGNKVDPDFKEEADKMLNDFSEELLNVDFKQLGEKKLNEALENSIFDGIDLTPLFDTLVN